MAVLDSTGDKHYHIAKVIDIGEQTTQLHYYATRGRRLRQAVWHPLYTQPHTNVVVMEAPDTINRNDTRFTGVINTLPLDEGSLILLPNVGMLDSMRVNSRTQRVLKTKAGFSHHRIQHTWVP